MKSRCNNPNDPEYANYGGRGITVCVEWTRDFPTFLRDIGRRPSMQHTLDRIDNNGNYEPGNCRWATKAEQARNTRVSRVLCHAGESLTITDWARRIGLSATAIAQRLRLGWTIEQALTPTRYGHSKNRPADLQQKRHKPHVTQPCHHCGKPFTRLACHAAASKGFCSKSCAMTSRLLTASAAGVRWRSGGALMHVAKP